jgi:uncharacterized protein YdaU (DUF1376 family)
MTQFPYQKWFENDFSSDPNVKALPFLARCVWRAVLQVMWANHGRLPADDRLLCKQLGCSQRMWKLTYKPLLEPLLLRVHHGMNSEFTQSRIRRDLELTAAKALKNKKGGSTTGARATRVKPESIKESSSTLSTTSATPFNGSAAMASSPAIGGRSSATPSNDANPATDALPDFGSFTSTALPDRLARKLAELGEQTVPAYLTKKTLKH